MFADSMVVAMVAVKDIAVGKAFYGGKLGLKQVDENPAGVAYQCGAGKLFVYQSEYAGTNQATTAAWESNDVVATVAELADKGVSFEHYDMPGVTWEGDVAVMGEMRSMAAWFKDPDGNILSVASN